MVDEATRELIVSSSLTEAPLDSFLPRAAPLTQVTLGALSTRPLVSVVVPSFNQGRFIRSTIDSILEQDYRPIEIFVMDGASTDETLEVLRSYAACRELRWVSETDGGIVEAVNKGFRRVHGEIVAIQSSDDCYRPGALSRVVDEFNRQPDVGLIYGDSVKVDVAGLELARHVIDPYSLKGLLLLKTWIPQPSAFFRRELLEAVGGWDDTVPYSADIDMWVRMAFRTRVVKIDRFLSQRRVHDTQRDMQVANIAQDYTRMIEQSPDIASAPRDIARAAHAGKHLLRVRYNPHGSDLYAAWSLIRAAWYVPGCLDLRRLLTHGLWLPSRRACSSLKKRVFGLLRLERET